MLTEEKETDAIKNIKEPSQRDGKNYDEHNLGTISESQAEQNRSKCAEILEKKRQRSRENYHNKKMNDPNFLTMRNEASRIAYNTKKAEDPNFSPTKNATQRKSYQARKAEDPDISPTKNATERKLYREKKTQFQNFLSIKHVAKRKYMAGKSSDPNFIPNIRAKERKRYGEKRRGSRMIFTESCSESASSEEDDDISAVDVEEERNYEVPQPNTFPPHDFSFGGQEHRNKQLSDSRRFTDNLTASIPTVICAVCAEIHGELASEPKIFQMEEELFNPLYDIHGIERNQVEYYDEVHASRIFVHSRRSDFRVCKRCFSSLSRREVPSVALVSKVGG